MNDSSPTGSGKEPEFSKTRIILAIIFALAAVANALWGASHLLAVAFIVAALGCVGCDTTVRALRDIALRMVESKRAYPPKKRPPSGSGRDVKKPS